MTPAAVALLLGAAVCHSAWNLAVKAEPDRLRATFWAVAVGALLWAPALLAYPLAEVPAAAWALLAVSAAFECAYVFALTAAYDAGDLSVVYPIARGTPPVVVAPLAVLVLGERLTPQGVAGIGLVVAGICASHLGSFRAWRALGAPSNRRATALALAAGLMTAGYSLANKAGVAQVPVLLWVALMYWMEIGGLTLILALGGRVPAPPREPRRVLVALAAGVLMVAAYVAVLLAMTLAPVSYVVAGREVSVVVAALLGAVFLGERHSAARVTAAAVVFAGLVTIALAR